MSLDLSHSFPERLHLELTSRCNYKCITCKHGYVNYGEDLDDNIINIILNDIMPHLKELELQGTGESLLSSKFMKVFQSAQENNCKVTLITNASLLTEDIIRKFVRANMQLVISLDGADSETFKVHRPTGDFDKIKSNLEMLSKYKRDSNNDLFSLVINMVITNYNYQTISDMLSFAKQYGVDYVYASEVRECMPDKKAWDKLRIDNATNREEIIRSINNACEYSKEIGIGFTFNPYIKNHKLCKTLCISPWKHMFVYANGDISVCCELNTVFGNITNSSFKDIWNGEKLNQFRNDMILKNYDYHCTNCCLPWGLTNE